MEYNQARRIRDYFSMKIRYLIAEIVAWKQTKTYCCKRYQQLKATVPKGTPRWVKSFLDGCFETRLSILEGTSGHIVYVHEIKGERLSGKEIDARDIRWSEVYNNSSWSGYVWNENRMKIWLH